jgi:hypothetical protein
MIRARTEATKDNRWTLKEIRESYMEILRAYNELFPLDPVMRKDPEETMDRIDINKENSHKIMMKMREFAPRLRKAADESGNAVSWHCGQSMEDLNRGLRERIEKAIRLGI